VTGLNGTHQLLVYAEIICWVKTQIPYKTQKLCYRV